MTANRLETVVSIFERFCLNPPECFNRNLEKLRVIDAGEGWCTLKLKVGPEHLNPGGALHGGFIATVVDMASFLAHTTVHHEVRNMTSTELSVSYISAIYSGDDVTIKSRVLKSGRNLVFYNVEIFDSNAKLCAVGKHTQFKLQSKL